MDSKIFGGVIKTWRLRADLSQKDLAEKSGLSESTVGAIERGERRLSDENFVKICIGLGMTVDEIFDSGSHIHLDVLHQIERRLRGEKDSEAPRREAAGQPSLEQISELLDSWTDQMKELLLSIFKYVRASGPEARFRIPPAASRDLPAGKSQRARVGRSRQRGPRK
ncbi:MAG TPA: helix-turn-helix transcriptional regulator [Thermoanaerobaculia bacterium]|nr:helix-turn-helix transcriptional regulator [Thermoanaerobaculia bacterium]